MDGSTFDILKLTRRPLSWPTSVDPATLETEVGGYSEFKN